MTPNQMMTFEMDRQGHVSIAEDTLVELDSFWSERIKSGSELAVVKTPFTPEDDELTNELLIAAVEANMSQPISLNTENRIHAFLTEMYSISGKISGDRYFRLIEKAILDVPGIRRVVARSLAEIRFGGKRYACHLIAENLYLAEVDPGMLMLKMNRKGKISLEMDTTRPNRLAMGPSTMDTLLGRRYPGIKIAQITVPTRLSEPQKVTVRNSLMNLSWGGVRYRLSLATGGLKNGKLVAVEEKYAKPVADRFRMIPQVALGYGGILANECPKGLATFEATVRIVKEGDLGTNDSRGWVSEAVFSQLKALRPGRFYQFRMDFEASKNTVVFGGTSSLMNSVPVNAKGCFKVMKNEVAGHREVAADIVLPDSCLKPARKELIGKTFRCVVNLGVTMESEDGVCYGAQSVAVHAPWEILSTEVFDDTVKMIEKVSQSFDVEGHAEVLHQIGADNKSDTDLYRMTEALLKADGQGTFLRHPYVHQAIRKLLAKWLRKLLSGGIEMKKRALADDGFLVVDAKGDLHTGSNWIPLRSALTDLDDSKRSLCVRFPVRMREDLLPVTHVNRAEAVTLLCDTFPTLSREAAEEAVATQLFLKATHVLHGKYAKVFGGDYDFDLVYVIPENRYPRLVDWRFDYIKEEREQPVKNKKKREDGWHELAVISFDAMQNRVGMITNAIMSAISAGKLEEVYVLGPELQEEVSGLKHDTTANMEIVNASKKRIGCEANWIKMLNKMEIRSFDQLPAHVDELCEQDVVARFYNKIYPVAADLIGLPRTLVNYRGLLDGRYGDREMTTETLAEARLVNGFFISQMGAIGKAEDDKRKEVSKLIAKQADARKRKEWEEASNLEEEIGNLQGEMEQLEMMVKMGRNLVRGIIGGWTKGKAEEDRNYWAAALNNVIVFSCERAIRAGKPSKATGAVLLRAFPQQVIDATANVTYTNPVPVEEWDGNWTIRFDVEKLQIVKVETSEDGSVLETLMYQGAKEAVEGKKYTRTVWVRLVDLGFLDFGALRGEVKVA